MILIRSLLGFLKILMDSLRILQGLFSFRNITGQDLSLVSRFTLSSLEPIKCTPFSPEWAPKFGTLFLIQLNYLNARPFVKR